jgi:hypothetical protein
MRIGVQAIQPFTMARGSCKATSYSAFVCPLLSEHAIFPFAFRF